MYAGYRYRRDNKFIYVFSEYPSEELMSAIETGSIKGEFIIRHGTVRFSLDDDEDNIALANLIFGDDIKSDKRG